VAQLRYLATAEPALGMLRKTKNAAHQAAGGLSGGFFFGPLLSCMRLLGAGSREQDTNLPWLGISCPARPRGIRVVTLAVGPGVVDVTMIPMRQVRFGGSLLASWRAAARMALKGTFSFWQLPSRGPSVRTDHPYLSVRCSAQIRSISTFYP
jgi:hypothetical protein